MIGWIHWIDWFDLKRVLTGSIGWVRMHWIAWIGCLDFIGRICWMDLLTRFIGLLGSIGLVGFVELMGSIRLVGLIH